MDRSTNPWVEITGSTCICIDIPSKILSVLDFIETNPSSHLHIKKAIGRKTRNYNFWMTLYDINIFISSLPKDVLYLGIKKGFYWSWDGFNQIDGNLD